MTRQRLTTLRAYALSAVFGAVGGLITIATIVVLDIVDKLIWEELVGIDPSQPSRTIFIFVAILVAALLLIMINRRLKKPLAGLDVILEELLEGKQLDWRLLPRAIGASLASIGSGASLGPEAPSAYISASVTAYTAEKTHQDAATARVMGIGSLSGMMGGLLDSPFLPAAMIIEGTKHKLADLKQLVSCTLVSSVAGVATIYLLFHKIIKIDLGIPPFSGLTWVSLGQAFLFGLAGAFGLIVIGLVVKKLYLPLRQRLNLVSWQQTLLAAAIVGALAFWLPLTMFSGQKTIPTLVAEASTVSALYLLVIGVVKMLSTAILLDSGFFGGPIFPALFAGTAFGLSFAHFINVSPSLAVPAAMAGLLTVSLKQPFSAALLTVAIMGLASAPIVVVATVGAMVIVELLNRQAATV